MPEGSIQTFRLNIPVGPILTTPIWWCWLIPFLQVRPESITHWKEGYMEGIRWRWQFYVTIMFNWYRFSVGGDYCAIHSRWPFGRRWLTSMTELYFSLIISLSTDGLRLKAGKSFYHFLSTILYIVYVVLTTWPVRWRYDVPPFVDDGPVFDYFQAILAGGRRASYIILPHSPMTTVHSIHSIVDIRDYVVF